MINLYEAKETNEMITKENLDVRTITLGISLMDCIDSNLDKVNRRIYDKITTMARNLVAVGEEIEAEYGVPIVNKRISVTPIALVGGAACKKPEDFVTIAETLADPFDPDGNGKNGTGVQFCQSWLHKDRHQYGRSQADGRDHQGNGRGDKRRQLYGLCEAGSVLQRAG